MKIKNRIYLNREISKNQLIEFDSRHSHYLLNVLRSKIGDNVCVFNESDEYVVRLSSVNRKKVNGTAIEKIKSLKLNNPLTLYFYF